MMSFQRALKIAGAILSVLAVLAFVLYFVVYWVYALDLMRWPFDYDQGEGFELYDGILFSQGEWPYRDNTVYPFYASNYPPLFHLAMVPLLPIFGPRLIVGRLVSLAATLVTGATIGIVVRRRVGGWVIPLISGLAFFASNYVYQIGPLSRLHMMMVMFETLAVAWIAGFGGRADVRADDPVSLRARPRSLRTVLAHVRAAARTDTGRLVVVSLLLLCAGYTKQLAIFTCAAVFAFVFIRDVKRALVFGAVLAVVALSIFGLINLATGGQWYLNAIQANVNQFDYRQTLEFVRQYVDLHLLLLILAGGFVVYELFWDRLSAYSIWFVFALGVGALSGKWGAGVGYFTTSISAMCILSGLALGKLQETLPQRWAWTRGVLAVAIPLIYLLQAPRTLHMPTSGPVFGPVARFLGVADKTIEGHCATFEYHDSTGYTQLGHLLTPADYAAGEAILDYVRAADGPAFSEEAMFEILTGRLVVTNPTQLYNLYNNQMLDTTEIVRRIYAQEFGVVIFRAQFYPPPVLEAIGQNYTPVDHVCMNGFWYHILWPRRVLPATDPAP